MRAIIYTGGTIAPQYIEERPTEDTLVIAADSGYRNARAMSILPQIIVGDFDSFPKDELPTEAEHITVPREKDFTDTQLAVDVALSRGADDILIVGGLSGRLDHTLSNLSLLEHLFKKGIRATLTDGHNRVRYINSTSELLPRSRFPYFSLLAVDEKVKGVSIEGAKYPLKNVTLSRLNQFAVSNEIEKNCILITVKKGGLLVIESRDPLAN